MSLNLTEKAGPLPVWAWGVIGGALIFGYSYFKSSRSAAAAAGAAGSATPSSAAAQTSDQLPANAGATTTTTDAQGNPIPATLPTGGSTATQQKRAAREYTVQKGDTLKHIARTFYGDGGQANVQKIRRANHLYHHKIEPGQILRIPK